MPKTIDPSEDAPNSGLADRLIDAVSDSLRRRILECLMQEPVSAVRLSKRFDIPLGVVSYHLGGVLYKKCAVVEIIEEHSRRGAVEKVYALKSEAYVAVIQWPKIPEPLRSALRGLSLASFEKVAIAALEAEAVTPRPGDDNFHAAWRTVLVDEDGCREIRKAMRSLAKKVKAAEGRCADLDPGRVRPFVVATAAFVPASPPAD
jgi:predicted transcriptional regulator